MIGKTPIFGLVLALSLAIQVQAQGPVCFNGSPDNLTLHEQLTSSRHDFNNTAWFRKEPVEFTDFYYAWKSTREPQSLRTIANRPPLPAGKTAVFDYAVARCGLQPSSSTAIRNLRTSAQEISAAVGFPRIKKTCVVAALQRSNQTQGYFCPTPTSKPVKVGSPGARGPCISPEIADYVTWAVNEAIECLSTPEAPIDPLTVLKKLNNETGFSFFQASSGGVGIGQLTSNAIAEVNQNTDLLERVKSSNKPACAPFKSALQKPQPDNIRWCPLLHYSEGLAANLIYSLGYFVHTRDDLMSGFRAQLQRCGIERADILNLGALAAYGAEGLGVRGTLTELLRKHCHQPDRFIAEAERRVLYLRQVKGSLQETLDLAGTNIRRIEDCIEATP
jgi:hypothetical protein